MLAVNPGKPVSTSASTPTPIGCKFLKINRLRRSTSVSLRFEERAFYRTSQMRQLFFSNRFCLRRNCRKTTTTIRLRSAARSTYVARHAISIYPTTTENFFSGSKGWRLASHHPASERCAFYRTSGIRQHTFKARQIILTRPKHPKQPGVSKRCAFYRAPDSRQAIWRVFFDSGSFRLL